MTHSTDKLRDRVTIKCTRESSARLGRCEVCGEWCTEVFMGYRLRQYHPGRFTFQGGIGHTFGHRSCLEKVLR